MELAFYKSVDIDNFDPDTYILENYADRLELLGIPEGRRLLTKYDPLLFSIVYLRDYLAPDGIALSFSRFHIEQYEWARTGLIGKKTAKQERRCVVAPRSMGKSTQYFLILSLWALAHHHRKFIVAFGATDGTAQIHLGNLKRQIDENQVLRQDYPTLCAPKKNTRGMSESDTKGLYIAQSGAVFAARGMDGAIRGLNIGGVRPDWQIYDDIEPDGSDYSAYQAEKRLSTLRGQGFYLNTEAVVTLVGTVTMYDSIIHQILQSITSNEYPKWVDEERIKCVYYPSILKDDRGQWVSIWEQGPDKFKVYQQLQDMHTDKFQLEMMNSPKGFSGGLWTQRDFTYGTLGLDASRWILVLDPASTTKTTSDQTGLAVVGSNREQSKVEVKEGYGVRLAGEDLRREVLSILLRNPKIKMILVESNVAGEHWSSILHGMPIQVITQNTSKGKPARFQLVHDWYQKGMVLHPEELTEVEGQMLSFPVGKHDDIADAVALGVTYFLEKKVAAQFGVQTQSYL